jgi:hypothetical protein
MIFPFRCQLFNQWSVIIDRRSIPGLRAKVKPRASDSLPAGEKVKKAQGTDIRHKSQHLKKLMVDYGGFIS